MVMSDLSITGQLLARSVRATSLGTETDRTQSQETTIHVPNVGNSLLSSYEQLRVASENIEDHLLFQNAVKRFFARNLSFSTEKQPLDLASELVIELTLAGYLKNNTIPESLAATLDNLITIEYESYWRMLEPDDRLRQDIARQWAIESLVVRTEQLFNDPSEILSFAAFAYAHFEPLISVPDYNLAAEPIDPKDYPAVLYIAIHKSLLRSNDANIRSAVRGLYVSTIKNVNDLIAFNIKYDRLASYKTTARISQVIGRNGAPLRILRSTCFESASDPTGPDITDVSEMQSLFSRRIDESYKTLRHHIKAGVLKSIIFLLLSKAIIGLVVEIPYDYYVTGAIAVIPLIINLLFPPLFIAATGLTLRTPSADNKQAIIHYLTNMLYQPSFQFPKLTPSRPVAKSKFFNILFIIIFLTVLAAIAKCLAILGFNMLQGLVFFVFISTASFLGYRLALQVKELELVPTSEGFFGLLRDTFYAPFIFVGRRISYRFARLNIIAQILDNVIELPLTTVLRLLRQWTVFLRNKQDEINN